MNQQERVTYTELALQHELQRFGRLLLMTEEQWDTLMLARADVDPLNEHKPYGMAVPQLIKGKVVMGCSATHLVRPLTDHDDDALSLWITYWIVHTALHFVILDWARNLGEEPLTNKETERRVDEEMRAHFPDFWTFAEKIKEKTRVDGW